MKIAVIGGGAAGITTAYLLDKTHDVMLFEKQPILGGNVRTLSKNVREVELPHGVFVDNGVIEFQRDHFVNFHKLMRKLGVKTEQIEGGSSGLFLANGRHVMAPGAIRFSQPPLLKRLHSYSKLLRLSGSARRLNPHFNEPVSEHRNKPVSAYLQHDDWHKWQKMLLMYAYSIPYAQIADFPAEIALPLLKMSGIGTKWTRIVDGVYSYFEAILANFGGRIVLNAAISDLVRNEDGVRLTLQDGTHHAFDKVVFATPPDQVLAMLSDPSDEEKLWFGPWQANHATTLIHTDLTMYKRYNSTYFTEFDVFEKGDNDAGYNAYLNRLSGLPESAPHYNLAYNLADRIDPSQVIHMQHHHTPLYSAESLTYRPQIIATNGHNHTYHAGAYLGNGLHEGAVSSALAVSKLLDGALL